MLSKGLLYKNKVNIAIILFLLIFTGIHLIKPSMFYNEDSSFRPFGVGFSNKTVIPIWLMAIILAIFSYLAVLFVIEYY